MDLFESEGALPPAPAFNAYGVSFNKWNFCGKGYSQ